MMGGIRANDFARAQGIHSTPVRARRLLFVVVTSSERQNNDARIPNIQFIFRLQGVKYSLSILHS
jgi:hypothetical protein